MEINPSFMMRCFDLARQGGGNVAPNPLVGAVIVHEGRIIGEGFHRQYGEAHAEVNAVNSVAPEDRSLLARSTLYVSLEPCCIHGNTPPCTDLIIRERIPQVVVSVLDQTAEVSGQGIDRLKAAGVEVSVGVLSEEGARLSAIRNTYVSTKRPYIILKTALSADGTVGMPGQQVWLTNPLSRRLVHRWRGEASAILAGAGTLRVDNPELTNRLYFGKHPLRVVIDRKGKLAKDLRVFDGAAPTLLFAPRPLPETVSDVEWVPLDTPENPIPQVLSELYDRKKSALFMEGGPALQQHFVAQGLWDEWRVLRSSRPLPGGIRGPRTPLRKPDVDLQLGTDRLEIYYRSDKR